MIFSEKRLDSIISENVYLFTSNKIFDDFGNITVLKRGYVINDMFYLRFKPRGMTRKIYECLLKYELYSPNYNKFVNMCKLRISNYNIREIPYYQLNGDLIRELVRSRGGMIGFIFEEFITHELIHIALKDDILNIRYLPLPELEDKRTQESQLEAMAMALGAASGYKRRILRSVLCGQIGFIPEVLITQEIANLAIECDANNIRYIPDCIITQQMMRRAVIRNPDVVDLIINHAPELVKHITPDIVALAKKVNERN